MNKKERHDAIRKAAGEAACELDEQVRALQRVQLDAELWPNDEWGWLEDAESDLRKAGRHICAARDILMWLEKREEGQ